MNKQIKINDNLNGIIRYLGSVDGKDGEWAGIELDSPLGKNNGTYKSKKYFECKDKYGLFVKYKRIERKGSNDTYCLINEKDGSEKSQIEIEDLNISEIKSNTDLNYSLFGDSEFQITEDIKFDRQDELNFKDKKQNKLKSVNDYCNLEIKNIDNSEIINPKNNYLKSRIEKLEYENTRIKWQNEKYKGLLIKLLDNVKNFTGKISDCIFRLQDKVNSIVKHTVKLDEKKRVQYLVRKLYFDQGKYGKKELLESYQEFKHIMKSHTIE